MRNILQLLCSHQLPWWMHSWIQSRSLWQSQEPRWDGVRQLSGEQCGCTEQRTCSQWNRRHLLLRLQGPVSNYLQYKTKHSVICFRKASKNKNHSFALTTRFTSSNLNCSTVFKLCLACPMSFPSPVLPLQCYLHWIKLAWTWKPALRFLIRFLYCLDTT